MTTRVDTKSPTSSCGCSHKKRAHHAEGMYAPDDESEPRSVRNTAHGGRTEYAEGLHRGYARGRVGRSGKRGRAIGMASKPFIVKKTGSGWKLFLRLDVMRQFAARAAMVDTFAKRVRDYLSKTGGPTGFPAGNETVGINAVPTQGDNYRVEIVRPHEARVISTKYRATSIAHHLGRYSFGLSDFVDSYVTYEK